MKVAAVKNLVNIDLDHSIKINKCDGPSAGCGITLWSESKGFVLGCLGLGERGKPADLIGKVTSENLVDEILSGSCIDVFCFDQLLAYIAMSENFSRCCVRNISNHAYTNMWLIGQFFKDRKIFTIEQKNDNKIVMIHGVGQFFIKHSVYK
jgi:RNA 3'-terminal phosphate cyclase (GTP)